MLRLIVDNINTKHYKNWENLSLLRGAIEVAQVSLCNKPSSKVTHRTAVNIRNYYYIPI